MTDHYAVIGNPISHTKSPLIHGLFAQAAQQDMQYTAIEGPLEPDTAFADVVRTFAAGGGKGMNVTAPFKLKAFAMADERSERATLAGAANALKFEGGRILAENFDGIGLVRDIEINLGLPMAGKRVLLLGAGGCWNPQPNVTSTRPRLVWVRRLTLTPSRFSSADRHADLQIRWTNDLHDRRRGHQFDPQGIPVLEPGGFVRLTQGAQAVLFLSRGCVGKARELEDDP